MISRSFGGFKSEPSSIALPKNVEEVLSAIDHGSYLPTGMSRSYGDVASITGGTSVSSRNMSRVISFDPATGVLVCEPGVLLRDIQAVFSAPGWMLPVSPGTGWVSIGGAIANDVHGKDHHSRGTFGEHVVSLNLARSSGEVLTCSRLENPEFLRATIGGLGLTGFILEATIQMVAVPSPYFEVETIPYDSVEEFFELSKRSETVWQGTVSWIDCSTSKAGRGIFTRGNPSSNPPAKKARGLLDNLRLGVPLTPPFSLVNKFTTDAFNDFYFKKNVSSRGHKVQHYEEFYYPLDGVANWNRIYGSKGFFQYQSIIPEGSGRAATEEMLSVIAKSGQGSFLSVLKTFADRPSAGLMSFARAGVTLALDFPNRGQSTERLFRQLDQIVMEAGGALNPSKDLRMPPELFRAGFQNWSEFEKFKDPACNSDFYKRVTQ